jgi:hypothetical protein
LGLRQYSIQNKCQVKAMILLVVRTIIFMFKS